MSRRVLRGLTLGLSMAPLLASSPTQAWFWDRGPEPQPPPIHVYDYTKPPVWTPNGWAYVPVEVHFPRTSPTVIVPPQNVMPPPPPPPRRIKATKPDAVPHYGPGSAPPPGYAPPGDPRFNYEPMPLPKLPPRRNPAR